MKRLFAGVAAALLAATSFFPISANAISAESAIVLDAQSGRVIYEKNPDKRSLIASTTKIMTALIICEQCNVLDRVRVPKAAVGIEGSSMYLQENEVLTVQELLYGLMLRSGNDAAVALAIYCGGTVEGFAQLMNDKARSLGMKDSNFVNPNGLDAPGHYSTARDLAILSAYAMQNPIFSTTVATKCVTVGGRTMRNHNKLLWMCEGVDGVKTGFTKAAGRILVSSAKREGRRLVAVTINAPNDWQDHISLLNKGFEGYQSRQIISSGEQIGVIEVAGGVMPNVSLVTREDFAYPLADNENVRILLSKPEFVYAPVVRGQEAGEAYICIGETVVGKVSLEYGDTVEQSKTVKRTIWDRLFGGEST